jgi:hypothetical protein
MRLESENRIGWKTTEHGHNRLSMRSLWVPVRRIERVRLHADLSILGRLTLALDRARCRGETHGASTAA